MVQAKASSKTAKTAESQSEPEAKASARKPQEELDPGSFVLPTQKIAPTVSDSAASGQLAAEPMEAPTIPAKDEQAKRTTALSVMTQVIKYVHHRWVAECGLPESTKLKELAPLSIEKNKAVQTNFRESWNPSSCQVSMERRDMYEAGGSVFWLDGLLTLAGWKDEPVLVEQPSMWEVLEAEEILIPEGQSQLYFGDPFLAYVQNYGAGVSFPNGMKLMRGIIPLFAWYLAACRVILAPGSKARTERLTSLHTMALTVSIRAYHFGRDGKSSVILRSLQNSEKSKITAPGDSFQMFVKKLGQIMDSVPREESDSQPKLLKFLVERNIRFNGSLVNRTLLQASVNFYKLLTPEIESVLDAIQREFGRAVWSSGYNKVMRLCQMAAKLAGDWPKETAVSDLVHFALDSCLMQLRRKQCQPEFYKMETLATEKSGWVPITCLKCYLIMHLHLMSVSKAAADKESESTKSTSCRLPKHELFNALQKVASPASYDENVPLPVSEETEEVMEDIEDTGEGCNLGKGSDEAAKNNEEQACADALARVTEKLPKAGRACVELIRDFMEGKHEAALAKLTAVKDPVGALMEASDKQPLGKAFRAAVSTMVATAFTSESADAPMSFRELARKMSDPEQPDESQKVQRQKVWTQAQQLRKKSTQLALWKGTTDSLKSLVEKSLFKQCQGKLNETHRVVFFSADLLDEAKGTWQRPVAVSKESADPIMKFLEDYTWKEHDILVLFDGGCQSNRDLLRTSVKNQKNLNEFVLLYSRRSRMSRSRKVFCASQRVETGLIKTFVPRVRVNVKERVDQYAIPMQDKKEVATTHDLSMVGLPPPDRRPKISIAEKAKTWTELDEPPKYRLESVPIYWAESKPWDCWDTLLACLDAAAVLDLTPGSGLLASVCMAAGITYTGITKSEDLSESVNKLFEEVLRELNDAELQESDEDDMDEEEEPAEAA
ncbi:unnamed protein product [Symbiodinium necroappetens]|uniref:Uncharacterized protein n=1 Tax=Symbiodinium necroappetens TaxID=1628268 RepID=A0A812THA5_9DINO|nr:unnamed protein product [Symbiodinium necroappetens]